MTLEKCGGENEMICHDTEVGVASIIWRVSIGRSLNLGVTSLCGDTAHVMLVSGHHNVSLHSPGRTPAKNNNRDIKIH